MDYEEFNIRFEAKGEGKYKVKVESAGGNDSAEVELNYDVDDVLREFDGLRRGTRSGEFARGDAAPGKVLRDSAYDSDISIQPTDLGKRLYQDLFVGAAASKFDQALGNARGRETGLRINIHIDPDDPEIARLGSLPWELLCHPNMGDLPLSLSRDTPIVRYVDSPRPMNLHPFQTPLRVLVVVSSPKGVEELDLETERRLIEETWGGQPDVEVHFLEKATMNGLDDELRRQDYHVLHYMGHGDFDKGKGIGILLMETESGEPDAVDGQTLGLSLQDAKSMRMVFLNACNTANISTVEGKNPYAGVASALVLAGVPSVIAMQFPIADTAAIAFTTNLYPRLVEGYPLDAAVNEARKAIRLADRSSLEWATPVLFMRTSAVQLFRTDLDQSRPTNPRQAKRKSVDRTEFGIVPWAAAAIVLIAGSLWYWYANRDTGSVVVEGQITDQTTGEGIPGMEVVLHRDSNELPVKTTTDVNGRFKLPVDKEQINPDSMLSLMVSKPGTYDRSDNPLAFTENKEIEKPLDLQLLPKNLTDCKDSRKHVVMVGNFGVPAAAASELDARHDNLARGLRRNLLPELQMKHLPTGIQPRFKPCPAAKPTDTGRVEKFALALGAEVFLYGDVVSAESGYNVSAYIGDRFGVFSRIPQSVSNNVNIDDPIRANLDDETRASIILVLAKGYEEAGQFADCVTVIGVAETLAASASADLRREIGQQRSSCQGRTRNEGLQ